MRKIIKVLAILIILLLCLAVLLPFLYQNEIKEYILTEVNKDLDGELAIKSVDISLIRSFPDLRVGLNDVVLTSNIDTTAPIFSSVYVGLDLNLMSVIRSEEIVNVNGAHLNKPHIYLNFPKNDGRPNYDIFPASDAQGEDNTAYALQIDQYSIEDGQIIFIDRNSGNQIELKGLQHEGNGNLNGDDLEMLTTTGIGEVTIVMDNNTYLNQARLNADVDFDYNLKTQRVELAKNTININDLNLSATGWLMPQEEFLEMDLSLDAPDNNFGSLWSITPTMFKQDYKDLRTKGNFELKGIVQGKYVYETGQLPKLEFKLKVDDGYVAYPDLPHPLEGIFTNVSYSKPQSSTRANINLQNLVFKAGQSHADIRASIVQNNNSIDANGFADIDLQLSDIPLSGTNSGRIQMNSTFKGTSQDIDAENYNALSLEGTANFDNVIINQDGLPDIKLDAPRITFAPEKVSIPEMDLKLNDSDIRGAISIENPLAMLLAEGQPKISAKSKSTKLDIDNLLSSVASVEEVDQPSTPNTSPDLVSTSILPLGLTMDWDGEIDQLIYDESQVDNIKADITIGQDDVNIRSSNFKFNDSDFKVSGNMDGVNTYLSDQGTLNGELKVQGQKIDLNPFMAEDGTNKNETSTESETIILPENIQLKIISTIDKVIYGDMNLNSVNADVLLENQELTFREADAEYLGGKMAIKGGFLSNGIDPSSFNLKYDVIKLPFEGVAEQISWLSDIVPLAKYIEGIFNSTLIFEGVLGKDMVPDLNTLTASGYIETLKGKLGKVPFLEKVSNAVAVKELEGLSLTNTKNWFEIKDGKFIIQPFEYNYQDIDLTIGGFTSLDQTVSFDIKADVPKEKLDKIPGGNLVNDGISWMTSEIQQRGLPFGEIKTYKLGIDVNGDILSPKVNVKLLDFSKSSIKETLGEKKEELKKTIKDTLEKKKDEIIEEKKAELKEKAEEAQDSIKTVINNEVDKQVDKAKEEVKKRAQEVIDSSLIEQGDKAVDKIKDKLKDFDIFNRKKK